MSNIPDLDMLLAFSESIERDDLRAKIGAFKSPLSEVLKTAPDANGYGSGTDTPTPEELNRLRAIILTHPDEGR